MKVVIRTDASIEIGTGHVMRCITLAKQLQREGANIIFICRDFPGNSISLIQNQGFQVFSLASIECENHWQWVEENWKQDSVETIGIINRINKIDLLIVDHYSLDAKWESNLRSVVNHIMVIDDLANRLHNCDILLDQNYYLNMKERYYGLVPCSCVQLLGPNYVLLREEFLRLDPNQIKRSGHVQNILIFFGGTDPTRETMKTLLAIAELNRYDINYSIVVGNANPQKDEIKQLCNTLSNVEYFCQVENMAELMMEADLCVGAGGTATWERSYLQLPTIIITIADNQQEVISALETQGSIYSLGQASVVTKNLIKDSISYLIENPERLRRMSECCSEIINVLEVKSHPVCSQIMELVH